MLDLLGKLIEQLNGAVFTLLAVLFVCFWVVWKLSSVVTLFDGFKKKNNDIDGDIKLMQVDIASIKATTDLLYKAHLAGLDTVKRNSPLSLTDLGQKIADDLRLREKVDLHWGDISKVIEKQNPSNPYDIQTAAIDVARILFESIFTSEERDVIKTYAYQEGKNLLEILPIIGILVRDRFLSEQGISTKEIDQHAPIE